MSNRRGIVSVGRRGEYPREFWGPVDFEAERRDFERLEAPLTHAPGGTQPELRFSIFPTPARGGARSRAIDALLAANGISSRR